MKKAVTIIGIGRVGLPLALVLSNEGYKIYGVGRDKIKISEIKKGKMPFIENGAEAILKKNVNKTFFPTTDLACVKKSNTIILTLGTPIDDNMNPVLDQITDVLDKIIPKLKKNHVVILRSTVSPGTTEFVKEKIEKSIKLKVDKDIFLAYCPERIAEGFSIKEIKEIPQIIGGIGPRSSAKAKDFFESFGVSTIVTDAKSAELAKLFTNMYRYISFAIANEFFVIAENFGRNIHNIVDLVNNGYKRNGLSLPGLTAGPCLYKDGFFLINDNPFIDLIATSWKINEAIPLFILKKLKEQISLKGKKVAVLGLSFKPDIDDTRESLSFKIYKALLREYSNVILQDPFVKKYKQYPVAQTLDEAVKGSDVVIIATRHSVYKSERMKILGSMKESSIICDVWNLFETNKFIFKKKDVKLTKI